MIFHLKMSTNEIQHGAPLSVELTGMSVEFNRQKQAEIYVEIKINQIVQFSLKTTLRNFVRSHLILLIFLPKKR